MSDIKSNESIDENDYESQNLADSHLSDAEIDDASISKYRNRRLKKLNADKSFSKILHIFCSICSLGLYHLFFNKLHKQRLENIDNKIFEILDSTDSSGAADNKIASVEQVSAEELAEALYAGASPENEETEQKSTQSEKEETEQKDKPIESQQQEKEM